MIGSAFRPHSPIGQTAWQDLRRLLKDRPASPIKGNLTSNTINGTGFLYDRYRLGNKVAEDFLGRDTPELRQQFQVAETIAAVSRSLEKETSRLVKLLKAEGYLTPDRGSGQIMQAMARAGVFRLGGVIVGTHAFRLYEGVLGVRLSTDQAAQTNDIDIASFAKQSLSLALETELIEPLPQIFSKFKFDPVPTLDKKTVWRWRQTEQQTLVEFLTPSFRDDENVLDLPRLGISAQSLHFLDYLITQPIDVPLLYRSGELVKVPRPERFAIHKLIVAARRRPEDADKAGKDRAQAAFLIRLLVEDDPDDLAEAYHTARNKGLAWRKAIDTTLARLPETREYLEALH